MEEDFTMLKDALSSSIDELCVGQPENRFDAWRKKNLYPALAVMNLMELRPDSTMCKERFEELLEGEAENEFDAWLRDRFYLIVAMMTLSGDMSGRL